MTRKFALLLFWLLDILFPMAWFTRFSAAYRHFFELAFTPQWTHGVTHLFLFTVLAYLLGDALSARWTGDRRRLFWFLLWAAALGVALLQEGIQLLYTGQVPGGDEVLDLGVDLVGGGIGTLIFWWRAMRRRAAPQEGSPSGATGAGLSAG